VHRRTLPRILKDMVPLTIREIAAANRRRQSETARETSPEMLCAKVGQAVRLARVLENLCPCDIRYLVVLVEFEEQIPHICGLHKVVCRHLCEPEQLVLCYNAVASHVFVERTLARPGPVPGTSKTPAAKFYETPG